MCNCLIVQRTPPRWRILAICLISRCVGMVPTWVHWSKKNGMTEQGTKMVILNRYNIWYKARSCSDGYILVWRISWKSLKCIFGMTKRSNEGGKYQHGHISGITYGTQLGFVLMDRYLFDTSYDIVLNKFGTTEWSKNKEVST